MIHRPNQSAYPIIEGGVRVDDLADGATYVQNGVPGGLPAGYYYCSTATCSLRQTGGGGNPPVSPDAWFVDGNNAFITRMS